MAVPLTEGFMGEDDFLDLALATSRRLAATSVRSAGPRTAIRLGVPGGCPTAFTAVHDLTVAPDAMILLRDLWRMVGANLDRRVPIAGLKTYSVDTTALGVTGRTSRTVELSACIPFLLATAAATPYLKKFRLTLPATGCVIVNQLRPAIEDALGAAGARAPAASAYVPPPGPELEAVLPRLQHAAGAPADVGVIARLIEAHANLKRTHGDLCARCGELKVERHQLLLRAEAAEASAATLKEEVARLRAELEARPEAKDVGLAALARQAELLLRDD